MHSKINSFTTRLKKFIIPSIGGAMIAVLATFLIIEAMSVEVAVAYDGEKKIVKTHANTVEELFDELGIDVGEHDAVSYDLNTNIENGMNIEYKAADRITVTIDGESKEYFTIYDTLEQFMEAEGLEFSEHDYVSLKPEVEIEEGLRLTVISAFEITVNDAGDKDKIWTTGGTVEQILEKNDIELTELDKVKPALDEEVTEEDKIKITRVEKKQEKAEESIAYSVEKKEDASLEKGKEKTVQEGKEGKLVKTIEITLENGKETDREVIAEEVVEESENKVVAVGTKEAPQPQPQTQTQAQQKQAQQKQAPAKSSSAQSNSSSAKASSSSQSSSQPSGGKEMTMEATAYTAYCNGCSGISAYGLNLKDNPNMKVIAVDPNVIPLGSKVWVEGYGTAIAGDTGGAIKGNRIDLHMPTKDAAYNFGRRSVKIKVLN